MKFLKAGLFFSFLFTQCFGMEIIPPFNPEVAKILGQLREKDSDQTLQPEEFWTLMESPTDMGSCFLGESLAQINEEDVCLILRYLIVFGQSDKNKFYVCMTSCLGVDGITPLNELIKRIPEVPTEYSKLCKLFSELLDLIRTLEQKQKVELLTQKDMYRFDPISTARYSSKECIADVLIQIIFGDANTRADEGGVTVCVEAAGTPELPIYKWDGHHFFK